MSEREARKARRRGKRREVLLDCAYGLLEEEGEAGFTVAAVAARADLSKASVYYYFRTKEALASALLVTLIEEEYRALAPWVEEATDGLEALQGMVRGRVARYREDPSRFGVIRALTGLTGVMDNEAREALYMLSAKLNGAVEARLEEDRAAGRLHEEVHPRQTANIAWMGVEGILTMANYTAMAGGELKFTLEALSEQLCGCLRRGCEARGREE